jgi:hypothetical protein
MVADQPYLVGDEEAVILRAGVDLGERVQRAGRDVYLSDGAVGSDFALEQERGVRSAGSPATFVVKGPYPAVLPG